MINAVEDPGRALQRLIEAEEFRELLLLGTLILQSSEAQQRQLEAKRQKLEANGLQLLKQARLKICPSSAGDSRRVAGNSLLESWYDDARFAVEALLDIAWRQFSGSPQWPYSNEKTLGPKEQVVREFQRRLDLLEESYSNLAPEEQPPKQLLWIYDYCVSVYPKFIEGRAKGGHAPRDLPQPSKLPVPGEVYAPKRARASISPLGWTALAMLVMAAAVTAEHLYVYAVRADQANSSVKKVEH